MGGKGSVLVRRRPPRQSPNALFEEGAHSVLNNCPDVKVVADAGGELEIGNGQVDDPSYLETHMGQKIDGVWDSSGMAIPAIQALEDSRRPGSGSCKGNPNEGIPRL